MNVEVTEEPIAKARAGAFHAERIHNCAYLYCCATESKYFYRESQEIKLLQYSYHPKARYQDIKGSPLENGFDHTHSSLCMRKTRIVFRRKYWPISEGHYDSERSLEGYLRNNNSSR